MQALRPAAIATGVLLATAPIAAAAAEPVGTLRQLGPALGACWHPPAGSKGSQLTVVFSLDRAGAVIGKPRISYAKLVGNVAAKRDFVAEALGSVAACTPVAVTPELGGAIAGRPLSLRFIGGPNGIAL